MGQSYNSGSTAVSGTVTAVGTFTPAKTTVTCFSYVEDTARTVTHLTVPANRAWRIVGMTAYVQAAGADNTFKILLNDVISMTTYATGGATAPVVSNQNITFDYSSAPVLATGQTIKTILSAGRGAMNIYYVEEVV